MVAYPPQDDPVDIAISPAAVAEVCFCHNLRRATRAVSRLYDRALQPLGLKASQFNVLVVAASTASATLPKVAQALAMDRTTLLRNLGPLKAAGYIETIPGSGRRPDQIRLTIGGENTLVAATRAWQQAQRQVTQHLGGSSAAQVLQGLGRLIS